MDLAPQQAVAPLPARSPSWHRLAPFFSIRLAIDADGRASLICNEARASDPLHLFHIDLNKPVSSDH